MNKPKARCGAVADRQPHPAARQDSITVHGCSFVIQHPDTPATRMGYRSVANYLRRLSPMDARGYHNDIRHMVMSTHLEGDRTQWIEWTTEENMR